jgi:hypothetical protein
MVIMTALVLTDSNLARLKKVLRERLPTIKSAHLTEALAAASGFRTHAALLTRLGSAEESWPDVVILDAQAFATRLNELGSPVPPGLVSAGMFEQFGIPIFQSSDRGSRDQSSFPSDAVLLKTDGVSGRGKKILLSSSRAKAWRNMMVAAVNAGIEQKLFHVLPGTNRWPGYSDDPLQSGENGCIYKFRFEDRIPAIAYVRSISWDELSVNVAFWPTSTAHEWVKAKNAGFLAGEAWSSGWLERRVGAYLQTSTDFRCRKRYLGFIASATILPRGFGDRGRIHM